MTNNDIALFSGLIVTLILVCVYIILLLTADLSPIERRARRLAILAAVSASAAIWGATAAVYSLSELIGSFLIFPSIGLVAIAAWHASSAAYRKMGGGNGSKEILSEDAGT